MTNSYQRARKNPLYRFWIVIPTGLLLSEIIYLWVTYREIENKRTSLLHDQETIQRSLEPAWLQFRNQLEQLIQTAAQTEWKGDWLEPSFSSWNFRSEAGLYLRLLQEDGKNRVTLVPAILASRKDGFTSCLHRSTSPSTKEGKLAIAPLWSLSQVYSATQILESHWSTNIRQASSLLQLRILETEYQKVIQEEIPIAIDAIHQTHFLCLLLDELPIYPPDQSSPSSLTLETIQLTPHWTRIHLFELPSGAEKARVRKMGHGSSLSIHRPHSMDEDIQNAIHRQENNCNLARQFEEAVAY
ncbi:hypothetical protein [Pajaroellobacter abortibovis]|uniref:Uncharacterized protein n=1 Tax=Pajaroellobacter abortibovis TaxID=1882918 RepID=A0A1L6MVM8_9BACT|nr:hypothetical protein [Pajaroellobacter abortibovis]APR99465.1 hypothetical protein BCY86_01295 [Pajaroellobacter abortibovis]